MWSYSDTKLTSTVLKKQKRLSGELATGVEHYAKLMAVPVKTAQPAAPLSLNPLRENSYPDDSAKKQNIRQAVFPRGHPP